MLAYLTRRILLGIISIWVITIISFAIIQLPPGDFITGMYFQGDTGILPTELEMEALRDRWGLNRPWIVQYTTWMSRVVRGDFGFSVEYQTPVRKVLGDRWLLTLAVAGGAIAGTWIFAIPVGIFSAVRQYSVGDHIFTFSGFVGLAVPNFLLALLLMYLAVIWLDQSVGGLFSPDYIRAKWSFARVWDMLQHLWIPAVVLGTAGTAALIRIMRANLLDELRKPYVVTARAKGLSEHRLIMKYPVRVAANPLISGVAFLIPDLFSGEVIVAVVLSLPTLGPLLFSALKNQDVMLSGSIIMIIGTLTVIGMVISDILLALIDPRIRLMN